MVSVATASLCLGMLKTGLRDLKCFLMQSWVCGAVPCLVVTLKVSLMLDGDVHAKMGVEYSSQALGVNSDGDWL